MMKSLRVVLCFALLPKAAALRIISIIVTERQCLSDATSNTLAVHLVHRFDRRAWIWLTGTVALLFFAQSTSSAELVYSSVCGALKLFLPFTGRGGRGAPAAEQVTGRKENQLFCPGAFGSLVFSCCPRERHSRSREAHPDGLSECSGPPPLGAGS